MKLRFTGGIIFTGLAFMTAVLMIGDWHFLGMYFDPASFIMAIFVPHVLISFMTPPSEQKKMIHEILTKEEGKEKILKKSLSYLNTLKQMIICSSFAAMILGVIGIMANLTDTSIIGPNMAVALIVMFYAALYILVVIEPLRLTAEKKLADQ
ncbi:MAG: hypothetical protein PQJ59_13290 [Spirochaetales bacterium]|nr:hypothetical protein [Spirochaetales bacterium]